MYTKNVGKSERVLRLLIGIILIMIGYQVSGISRFLAYFVGVLMLLTSLLGWCFLYGFLRFSSRGKGMNKIPSHEIERVVRENKITPVKVSVTKINGVKKKVIKAAPKKVAVKKAAPKKAVAKKAPVKKAPPKKVVAKKAPVKKAASKSKK